MSNITLKALCLRCNSKVLGDNLMKPVSEIIADLFSGKATSIQKKHVPLVKNYFSRIAMMVDIASSNFDVDPGVIEGLAAKTDSGLVRHDPIISDTDRKKFVDNIEAPGNSVYAPKIAVMVANFFGDGGHFGRAAVRQRRNQVHIPIEKEFIMVYHRLAFILCMGRKKPTGTYAGFKLLPNNYFKDQFKLPVVYASQLNALFDNGTDSGPQRT